MNSDFIGDNMEQYKVTGMSCAACQTRVEKAVSAVDGVESCAVSLLLIQWVLKVRLVRKR